MKIHVKAFASFRDILGKDLDVDLKEGSTVEDLLETLVCSRQSLKSAIFDEAGKIREYVILMKNRKDIDSLKGLGTELSEGDEVAILPPVAGG
ncbi:MAG: MoaD family protein [Methanotrichaceae archaeon]|nr:MoaD family protein [Methanotrichaceae archaeon]